MTILSNRRDWLFRGAMGGGAFLAGLHSRDYASLGLAKADEDGVKLAAETREFILRCRREDGSYAPSPDPAYTGESDTKLSDLAAVTYAAVLAKTMGWKLPEPKRSAAFIARHQREDGRFI